MCKICPHCRQSKPTEDFSPKASWCKECINSREKLKREKERELLGFKKGEHRNKSTPPTHKICKKCGIDKSVDMYPKESSVCKNCKNAAEREFRKQPGYSPPKRTTEYAAWCEMRKRCLSETHPAYKDYGARGITIDSRWDNYSNFLEDMGEKPSPELTLERKDNNSGYSPENCNWSSRREQGRNRRSNRISEINGECKSTIEWAETTGLDRSVIDNRIRAGCFGEDLIRPVGSRRQN